jgi:predicted transcriptional regulator
MVRDTGNYEQWVDYFLKGVVDIAGSAMATARQILELQSNHRRLLWEKKISSPIAVGILEQLFYTPAVSVGQLAGRFGISYQAASTIVLQLVKAGILRETTGRKRDKRFVYGDYLNILSEGTKI